MRYRATAQIKVGQVGDMNEKSSDVRNLRRPS